MKQFKKNNEVKPIEQIVIKRDGTKTYNPSEAMLLKDGWALYEKPTEEVKSEFKLSDKNKKRMEIESYDAETNSFSINGVEVWFNKDERMDLKFRFESEKLCGKEETNLWYNDQLFVLPVDFAIKMISELEVYASECFDTTKFAKRDVAELSDEEAKNYPFKDRYPSKLEYHV